MLDREIKVLLVEDDPNYANLIGHMLAETDKFDIVYADNLSSGLGRLTQNDISVVLLDLSLPDSQGQETFVTLDSLGPPVPTVVLTGLADTNLANELLRKGAQDYLEKASLTPQLLVRSLNYAIERHRIQADLAAAQRREQQASESRFLTLIETTTDGIVVLDRHNLIQFANQAAEAILPCNEGSLIGQPFPAQLVNGQATEFDSTSRGGKTLVLEMKTVEIEWKHDCAHLVSLHDITERKNAEIALHELNQMKSEFVATISHELRTPLHAILGINKLMLDGKVPDPEVQKEFLTMAVKQSDHLASLINDLIDVSSMEAGLFKINKQPVAGLPDLITSVAQESYGLAEEKAIKLTTEIPTMLCEVQADESRLKQVIVNLVGNAIKFSQIGGEVIVTAIGSDEGVIIQVRDFGIGIPENVVPQLFDRFYRVDNKSTRSTGGSGLGLYISKQIVKGHGGRIWVESALGQGSTFSFFVPAGTTSPALSNDP